MTVRILAMSSIERAMLYIHYNNSVRFAIGVFLFLLPFAFAWFAKSRMEDEGKDIKINWEAVTLTALVLSMSVVVYVPLEVSRKASEKQGEFAGCLNNCRKIGIALRLYADDNEGHYPCGLKALVPDYLKAVPRCPQAGRDTYSGSYRVYNSEDGPGSRITFYCSGENHPEAFLPSNWPQFSSQKGLMTRP